MTRKYRITLKGGGIADVEFESKEAVRKWLETGVPEIVLRDKNIRLHPGYVERITDITELMTCPNCGKEKNVEEFKILGKIRAHEKLPEKPVVINRVKLVCSECWEKLGGEQAED